MNLKTLSDEAMVNQTQERVKEEKRITLEILHHLIEIEDRYLFAREGYSSLFEMAVKKFHYTEAQAHRRISAARLLRQVPAVEEKVKTGALNISQLAQAQTFFRAEKKDAGRSYSSVEKAEVLSTLEGRSARETERLFLERSPVLQAKRSTEERTRVVTPELTEVRFTLDGDGLALLEEAKALFAHNADMNPGMADLFKKGLALLVVQRKKERGGDREPINTGPAIPPITLQSEDEFTSEAAERAVFRARRRAIPAVIRKKVFQRDGHRCQFVSPGTGRTCHSTHALEVHHRHAYAKGGAHTWDNLQVLCRAHHAAVSAWEFGKRPSSLA